MAATPSSSSMAEYAMPTEPIVISSVGGCSGPGTGEGWCLTRGKYPLINLKDDSYNNEERLCL